MVRFGENKNAISPGGKEKALEAQSTQSEPAKEEQQNTKPAALCGISTEAENSCQSILLQTAVVRAVNPDDPNKSVNLHVILDSGSQRTYITKNAREILKLSTVSEENVIIKVFGSDDDEINSYDLVALELASLNDNFEINVKCLEVPLICSPLTQGQAIDCVRKNYSHLEGLTLADDSSELENLEVHILLGADFLWHIMTGEIQQVKDENEPVAIGIHFGYVLSGPVSNMPQTLLSRVNLSCTHVL